MDEWLNKNVKANFEIKTYTVNYDANGGSNAPAAQTKTYGVDLVLTSAVPTLDGYDFVQWATRADGSGAKYESGSIYTVNESVT